MVPASGLAVIRTGDCTLA